MFVDDAVKSLEDLFAHRWWATGGEAIVNGASGFVAAYKSLYVGVRAFELLSDLSHREFAVLVQTDDFPSIFFFQFEGHD